MRDEAFCNGCPPGGGGGEGRSGVPLPSWRLDGNLGKGMRRDEAFRSRCLGEDGIAFGLR